VPPDDEPLHLFPAAPARVLAAAIPLAALLLVSIGAARGAMDPGADSPLSPWIVALATLAGAILLSWRALTQTAVLGDDGLVSRNLTSTVRANWSTVEELRCVPRPGLVTVEIHLRGTRRRLQLGAATRWAGHDADAVAAMLAAHPRAGALLVRDGS
jgi:hypothetical protein